MFHDLVGLTLRHPAKFVRAYTDLRQTLHDALSHFKDDILEGRYPGDSESYHCPPAILEQFEKVISSQPRS